MQHRRCMSITTNKRNKDAKRAICIELISTFTTLTCTQNERNARKTALPQRP